MEWPAAVRLATVGSTMDVLHRLASEGAAAGTAVVAEEQTGGRGSRGRRWHSGKGGLWLSVLLRPAASTGAELFSLRVGLSVAQALEAFLPGRVGLKWPNDLMIGERKLGGILCEARWQGDSLAWVVTGAGINVSNELPAELSAIATSLSEWVPGITPAAIESSVIAGLRAIGDVADRLDAGERERLAARDWLRGRSLRAPIPGTAAGIAEDGALLVRTDAGDTTAVRAGSVELAGRGRSP